MKLSKTGYRKDSKDKKEKSLVVPSGRISMANVDFPVFGMDNTGVSRMMMPGGEYMFPGSHVMETPVIGKKQQGGITPGYVSQSVGFKQLSKKELQQTWETNPNTKGKPFRTEYEVKTGADGKPFHSYYFYGAQSAQPAQQMSSPMASAPKPTILDPMKQVGYNGMLAPESYQLGGLLSNPLIQMAAPIAANVLLPGSGALVGMGMKMLSGAQQGQQQQGQQQEGQQSGGGGLGSLLSMAGGISKIAGMFEKGGPTSGDTRKFLQKRNDDFVDYVASNNRLNMLKEGVSEYYKKQMGGEQPFTLNPDASSGSNFNTSGPFGAYGTNTNTVPDYVQNNPQKNSLDMQQFVPVMSNMGTQIGDQLKGDKQPSQQGSGFHLPTSFGDAATMALNFYNKSYADVEARRKEKWLEQQQTIEHTAPIDYGSRGDYDVNSGAFRPDQMYQMGGSNNKQIRDFAASMLGSPSTNTMMLYNRMTKADQAKVDSIMQSRSGYSPKNIPFTNPPSKKGEISFYDTKTPQDSAAFLQGYNRGHDLKDANFFEWITKEPLSTGVYGRGLRSGAYNKKKEEFKMGGKKCYKKGGVHTVSDTEISDLIKQGIQFEFID